MDALTVNPVDRSKYASASHDKTIRLWDANTHQCLKTMTGHADGLWSLNYLQDGQRMISSSVDGSVKLWDTNTGKAVANLNYHPSKVYCAIANEAFS